MTVRAWLSANNDLERLDAELLVAEVLGCSRARVIAHPELELAVPDVQTLQSLGARLRDREPLAYLLERKEFCGIRLNVDRRVLVPRPETELLVELVLDAVHDGARILDLGTGSGAIAIALKVQNPALNVVATDRSADALAVARTNATANAVEIRFVQSDWFADIDATFDAIVCNPPYVAERDPHLDNLCHEPGDALIAGADGLTALNEIIPGAPRFLRPGGLLAVEHGCDQGSSVRGLFNDNGYESIATHSDLAGLERATVARRSES